MHTPLGNENTGSLGDGSTTKTWPGSVLKRTGIYHVCFCGSLTCTSSTYTILAGVIVVHGPNYDSWTTSKLTGKKFDLAISGSGAKFGVLGQEYIRLVQSTAIGGTG